MPHVGENMNPPWNVARGRLSSQRRDEPKGPQRTSSCAARADPCRCPRRQKVDKAKPLEGPRYRLHDNGTLQIVGTAEEDAGAYSCWVENAKGKTAVTATLDVRSNSLPIPRCVLPTRAPRVLRFPDEA